MSFQSTFIHPKKDNDYSPWNFIEVHEYPAITNQVLGLGRSRFSIERSLDALAQVEAGEQKKLPCGGPRTFLRLV